MRTVLVPVEVEAVDGANLLDAVPELQDLVVAIIAFLRLRLGKAHRITITSVIRNDPRSVHAYGRGVDITLDGIEDDPKVVQIVLEMMRWFNLFCPYTNSKGHPGDTIIFRKKTGGQGSDTAHRKHFHIQIPTRGWR